MRLFGFFVIRWPRLQEIHTRNAALMRENGQLLVDLDNSRSGHDVMFHENARLRMATAVQGRRIEELELQLANMRTYFDLHHLPLTAHGPADSRADTKEPTT